MTICNRDAYILAVCCAIFILPQTVLAGSYNFPNPRYDGYNSTIHCWPDNRQIAVRVDSAISNPLGQSGITEAFSGWSGAVTCANVTFTPPDFSSHIVVTNVIDTYTVWIVPGTLPLNNPCVTGDGINGALHRRTGAKMTIDTAQLNASSDVKKFYKEAMLHEIGHTFGLDECYYCPNAPCSFDTLMAAANAFVFRNYVSPFPRDVEQIQELGRFCLPIVSCSSTLPGNLDAGDAHSWTVPSTTPANICGPGGVFYYADHLWLANVQKNYIYTISVTATSFVPRLSLWYSDYQSAITTVSGAPTATIVRQMPYTGSYLLEISSPNPNSGSQGSYTLTVTSCAAPPPPPPPPPTCNCPSVPNPNFICTPCNPAPGGTGCCDSPIIIDVADNGFDLSSEQGGVYFDFTGTGASVHMAWTKAGSDDAWLALDRNSNGKIDSGRELFGNMTAQPVSNDYNGYNALSVFDDPQYGGNGNYVIDAGDQVFTQLRLWQDVNHNGVSESSELHSLPSLGVTIVAYSFVQSDIVDSNGNWFRYLSGATIGGVNRKTYDVFLQYAP